MPKAAKPRTGWEERLPKRSKAKYVRTWEGFWSSTKKPSVADVEAELRKRKDEGQAVSSLWTYFSILKCVHQAQWSSSESDWEDLKKWVKRQEEERTEPVKKATAFVQSDVEELLIKEKADGVPANYFLLWKCQFLAGFFGGLRKEELHDLSNEGIITDEYGSWVPFTRLKQRCAAPEKSLFLIPAGPANDAFTEYLGSLQVTEGVAYLWRKPHKNEAKGYVQQRVGINKIAEVTKEIAKILGKKDPKGYTSHSMRRSSATAAVEGGASPMELMKFYGWRSISVAEGYVTRSRLLVKGVAKALVKSDAPAAPQPTPVARSVAGTTVDTPAGTFHFSNMSNTVINFGAGAIIHPTQPPSEAAPEPTTTEEN